MTRSSRPHDALLRAAVDEAVRQGWAVRLSKHNHLVLLSPDGVTTLGCSITNIPTRSLRNQLANFKRAGIIPSPPQKDR